MSEPSGPGLAVAVSGHRELADPGAVAIALEKSIAVIEQAFPRKAWRLLSPLAEGTDRLVATLILPRTGWTLWGILPLPVEAYRQTFPSAASRREFDALMQDAHAMLVLRPPDDPLEAYRKLGVYLVEHCDVLLAAWDGRPARGPGGTAEIVGMARERGLPVALVSLGGGTPGPGASTFERFPPSTHARQGDGREW